MFNKRITLLVAAFFLISLSVFAFAANEKKLSPEEEKAVKQRIKALEEKEAQEVVREINTVKVSVDDVKFPEGTIIAITDDNVEMTFYAIRGETVILKEKKSIKLEGNIREGDDIEVSYYIDSEGKFIATKVNLIINADAK